MKTLEAFPERVAANGGILNVDAGTLTDAVGKGKSG